VVSVFGFAGATETWTGAFGVCTIVTVPWFGTVTTVVVSPLGFAVSTDFVPSVLVVSVVFVPSGAVVVVVVVPVVECRLQIPPGHADRFAVILASVRAAGYPCQG